METEPISESDARAARPAGRPRNTEQRGNTKALAIAAAEALLLGEGPDAMSMAAVARSIGIRKASLYFHFPNGKEELLLAVIERRTADDGAAIIAALHDEGTARQHLLAIARRFAARPGRLQSSVKDASHGLAPEHRAQVAQLFLSRVYAPIHGVVAAGVATGEFRPHDASKSAWVFLTLLSLLAPDAAPSLSVGSGRLSADDVVDLLVDGMATRTADGPRGS